MEITGKVMGGDIFSYKISSVFVVIFLALKM